MKILYFLDYPYGVGGASLVLLKQAFILKQRGYQVRVVIPDDEKGRHAAEFDKICENFGVDTATACYTVATCMESIDIVKSLEEYAALEELLREYKAELVHSTQLNLAAELASRELKIPHLMNIYQTDEEAFNVKWMKAYPKYHSADSLLAVKRWGNGLGIPSRCVRIAYEEKSVRHKSGKQRRDEQIHIITIGQLCERKNQLEIIKFILECRKNGYNVQLKILGNSEEDYELKCKEFVRENKLDNCIFFVGLVLNIEDFLSEADVFIMASTVESYPGVIVESMANKVPIISTPVAGVPELLKDEDNGFLTTGYKAENIYQTFLRYLVSRDNGQILRIIERAYETYLENHTYHAAGERLDHYYQWIVGDFHKRKDFCLSVAEIREEFERFVSKKKIDRTNRALLSKLWLLYHICSIYEKQKNKQIIIWGAGFWGKITLEWICLLDMQDEFVGFIDKNKQGEYLGYPIISEKRALIEHHGMIIVSVENTSARLEIMNDLDGCGKIRNKDYFMLHNSPIRI